MLTNSETKHLIQKSFNRAALTYDQHCDTQLQAGETLIHFLQAYSQQFDEIIDLGCGTGLITEKLVKSFQFKVLHAVDIAEYLLDVATIRLKPYPVTVFYADFETPILNNNSAQLVFSNMALQWSLHLEKTLKLIYAQLKTDGIFAFSLPVSGTFSDFSNFEKNKFYSIDDISHKLTACDFTLLKIESEMIVHRFDSAITAFRSIKAVGANFTFEKKNHGLQGKEYFNKMINANQENYSLTYKIAYFIVKKGK